MNRMEQKRNSFDKAVDYGQTLFLICCSQAVFNKVVSEDYKTNSKKAFRQPWRKEPELLVK